MWRIHFHITILSFIAIQLDQARRNTLWIFVNLQPVFWGLTHFFISKARGFKSVASNLFLHVPGAITGWQHIMKRTATKLTPFLFSGNSWQRDKINEIGWLIFQNHFQKLSGNVNLWSWKLFAHLSDFWMNMPSCKTLSAGKHHLLSTQMELGCCFVPNPSLC